MQDPGWGYTHIKSKKDPGCKSLHFYKFWFIYILESIIQPEPQAMKQKSQKHLHKNFTRAVFVPFPSRVQPMQNFQCPPQFTNPCL